MITFSRCFPDASGRTRASTPLGMSVSELSLVDLHSLARQRWGGGVIGCDMMKVSVVIVPRMKLMQHCPAQTKPLHNREITPEFSNNDTKVRFMKIGDEPPSRRR
ncbi:hypothetical protein RUM43_013115 [Polyplax serrata]|uniref:Uncharacterized protein n=1 Tax=Polyplax serrata TaxID=468196 RepID=A0AAN8S780_POLSC